MNLIRLGLVAGSLLFCQATQAMQLITKEEASLPPPKGAIANDRRGILRGPKVEVVAPVQEASSPLELQLKFRAFGGAKIDPASVKVIYLRSPNVDLTPRVKPFIRADGIDMPDTEVPPGEYTLQVDVRDSDGRAGYAVFVMKISQ